MYAELLHPGQAYGKTLAEELESELSGDSKKFFTSFITVRFPESRIPSNRDS